jgi:hypothetical protein
LKKGEFFPVYLGFLKDRGLYEVLAHQFQEAIRFEEKIKGMIDSMRLSDRAKCRLDVKLHHYRLARLFKSSNFEALQDAVQEVANWLRKYRPLLDDRGIVQTQRLIATYSFYVEDYSNAIRWIFPLRTKDYSHLSAFAWIFYLIVRFEKRDFDIVRDESQETIIQLEKSMGANSPYVALVKALADLQEGRWKDTSSIAQLSQMLDNESDRDKLNYYFPFSLWLEHLESGNSMWQEIQNRNVPLYQH